MYSLPNFYIELVESPNPRNILRCTFNTKIEIYSILRFLLIWKTPKAIDLIYSNFNPAEFTATSAYLKLLVGAVALLVVCLIQFDALRCNVPAVLVDNDNNTVFSDACWHSRFLTTWLRLIWITLLLYYAPISIDIRFFIGFGVFPGSHIDGISITPNY